MIGRVTFVHVAKDGKQGFGFLKFGGEDFYFKAKTARTADVRVGDRVQFELGNFRPGKGPTANWLEVIEDEQEHDGVATLPGEYDILKWEDIT
jgi:hypothetical protein